MVVIGNRDVSMEAHSVQDREALSDAIVLWDIRDKAAAEESTREAVRGRICLFACFAARRYRLLLHCHPLMFSVVPCHSLLFLVVLCFAWSCSNSRSAPALEGQRLFHQQMPGFGICDLRDFGMASRIRHLHALWFWFCF